MLWPEDVGETDLYSLASVLQLEKKQRKNSACKQTMGKDQDCAAGGLQKAIKESFIFTNTQHNDLHLISFFYHCPYWSDINYQYASKSEFQSPAWYDCWYCFLVSKQLQVLNRFFI